MAIRFFLAGLFLYLSATWLVPVSAGELKVVVADANGMPIANAVVSVKLTQRDEPSSTTASGGESGMATIAQRDQQFVPFVTAIQIGTAVAFPNLDKVLHNVYSFSKSKKFQLPLYRDQSPTPVVFDKPGTVILGCNIHDWMVAYVYVLDTPYFGKTDDDGVVELDNLPAGDYAVQVYHPRKRKRGSTPMQELSVTQHGAVEAEFAIALKPDWRRKNVSHNSTDGN